MAVCILAFPVAAQSGARIEALPEEPIIESVAPEPAHEPEPPANEMIGAVVFYITLGTVIAVVSVKRRR